MEGSSTTITITTTTSTSKSDQSNKENVPPFCDGNKGKIPISQKRPSFKNKKKKNKGSKRKPKSKRVPLADITALFNNSASTTTTTTSTLPHQPQIEVSALPSDPSISRRKTVTPASKTLRMGFR